MSSPFSDEEIQRINADVWGGAEDLERDRTKLRTYVNVQAKDPAPQRAEALQIQRRTGVPWSLSEIDMDEMRARDAYQQLGPVRVENSPAWGTFLKGPLAPIALKNPEKTRAIGDAIDWQTVGTPQQGLVGASIDRGMHMTTVGQLGTRVYMGIASDADVLKFHEMRHNWPVVPDSPGYFDDAASMVVEQGPVLASIATYAATGGAAAGLVGLGSGPGAAAFAAGGAWTGAGYGSFVLEGGLAYAELLDVADEIHRTSGETIPHEAVVGASMLVGFLNAGLEMGAVGALLRITGLSRLRGNLTGEAATEIIKSKTLRPYLVSFAKRMGKAMAVEGGQEMGQESVNMVAATILVESTTSQTRDILTEENVKRLLHAGAAGALVGGSIQVAASPIVAASQRVGMNKATLAHAKRLDAITAARLDDGGLADADPEAVREWYQGQLDEGGGDTNLYIPAGVLAELFQDDEGLSDAVHSIPEVADQLSEVLIAANADVVIPISDYATYLAAHHEKLKGLLHHGLGERNTTEVEANAAEDEANLRTELAALAGVDQDGQPLDLELSEGDGAKVKLLQDDLARSQEIVDRINDALERGEEVSKRESRIAKAWPKTKAKLEKQIEEAMGSAGVGRAEALEQSLIEKLVRTASASPEAAARLADLIKQHAERRASDPAVGERAFEEADIDIRGPLDEQAAAGGLGQPVDLESMLNDLRGTPTPRAESPAETGAPKVRAAVVRVTLPSGEQRSFRGGWHGEAYEEAENALGDSLADASVEDNLFELTDGAFITDTEALRLFPEASTGVPAPPNYAANATTARAPISTEEFEMAGHPVIEPESPEVGLIPDAPTPRAEATPESAELAAMLDQLGFDLEQMTNEEVIEALGDRFAATTLNQEVEGEGVPVPESVDAVASLDGALELSLGKKWKLNRDLKVALQERVLAEADAAGVDLSVDSKERQEYLVRVGARDALTALEQNPNAVGWYDLKTRQALAVLALIHPEIATDPDAKFAFVYILATTSNGLVVSTNFPQAEKVYAAYKKAGGRMPTDMGIGTARGAVNKTLGMFNDLVDQWGVDNLRSFMLSDTSVGDIASVDPKLKPSGELVATLVRGASIIGPKIGNGFFSNLYGAFDKLTMDRWLVRTWGRWTGTLIKDQPAQTQEAMEKLEAVRASLSAKDIETLEALLKTDRTPFVSAEVAAKLRVSDMSTEELAFAIQKISTKPENRTRMNETAEGSKLRKAGNNLAGYLDGQKEDPDHGTERNEIRAVFDGILAEVQKDPRYADMEMSDLQAVMWYAEKRLYETSKDALSDGTSDGYEDTEAPDYANAAVAVARSKNKRESRIQKALKGEENGRSGTVQPGDREQGATGEGQPEEARGFTGGELKQFRGALATLNARSHRSSGETAWNYVSKGRRDSGGDGLLEWTPGKKLAALYKKAGVVTPKFIELESTPENASRFAAAIEASKAASKFGAAVRVYDPEEYQGMRLLLSESGKSGVAVKPDGDIVSLFSSEGAGRSVVEVAIAAGGTKADAFDTVLADLYAAHGLKVVSRLKWDETQAPKDWDKKVFSEFNNGEPDVVFMVVDPASVNLYRGTEGVKSKSYGSALAAQKKAMRAVAKASPTTTLNQPAGEGVRGSLTYNNELTTAIMRFTKAKNLSTGLHEAGHLFFAMMLKDARTEGIDPKLLEDMQTAIDYLGMDSLESLLQDSQGNLTEEAVAAHEKWADSFVAYLREGKAPSVALRASFSRFKSWLLNLYKTMRGLNVELTPEIREVFDRLLASDEQITQAKQQDRMMPVFESAEAAEMTPAQFAAYQQSYERMDTKAQEELGKKVMRELDRELTAEWKENWEKVQAQVEAEINADPIVQLRHLLQFKTPLNEEEPEGPAPMRLDLDTIKESYGGKSTVKALGGTGSYSMVQKDGIHPELLAPQFGFESGQEVVDALVASTNRKLSIKIETDKRMKATYGDILNDGTLSELAIDALENDEKGNFLIRQQRILGHRAGIANNIPQAIARDVAREVVQNKQIRSLRPDLYRNAEARAAREALDAVAAGDWQAAHEAGRKQLLNHFLAVAAVKAKEQTTKWHGYTKTFDKKAKRERLARAGEDYLEQIDSLLGRFDLRQMSNKKADLALADWVQARIDAAKAENEGRGVELIAEPAFVINDEMLDREFSKHWRTMTVSEMGGLVDALKNIEHLAMAELKLLLEQDRLDFETRVEQALETINAHQRTDKPISIETGNQIAERNRLSVGAYFASHRKLGSLLAEMDGGYGGVLFDMIIRPMDEAGTIESSMRIEAGTRLGELFAPYMGATKMERAGKRARHSLEAASWGMVHAVEMSQKKKVPGTGPNVKPMSKIARLMAVLNMGNAGNLQRLTDGHGWSQSDALAILNTLTKEDMDFVQGVWDFIEEYWVEVAELQRKIAGVAPKKIQRQAIETRHGTYAGGYFPAVYDPVQDPKAYSDAVVDAAKNSMAAVRGKAKTQDSFTKQRAAKVVGRKIRLDFGVIFSHVGDVVHRLAWQEWLIDTGRLLADKRIAGAIMQGYGSPVYRTMIKAHEDIAAGDVPAEKGWEQAIDWMRKGSSIAGMGLSITTAMLQPYGITQSMVRIGPKWVGRGIAKWWRGPEEMNNTIEWIHSLSKMMKHRADVATSDMNREIREVQSDLTEGGVLSPASKSYFYMIVKSQQLVDIPTWLGAYEKEMEIGSGDESRAVAMADRAVIDAQGGGQIQDQAAIQRGGPMRKAWTNFYSFFNTTWNNTVDSYRMNDFEKPADFGKFLVDMLLLYTVPAVLSDMMRDAIMDRWDEDESWAEYILWSQVGYMLGTLVGPREVSGLASGYADWDGPAGVRGFSAANAIGKQIGQGEADAALFKATVHAVGIFGHLPSVAAMRFFEGGEALVEGETKNPAALLIGAPRSN